MKKARDNVSFFLIKKMLSTYFEAQDIYNIKIKHVCHSRLITLNYIFTVLAVHKFKYISNKIEKPFESNQI